MAEPEDIVVDIERQHAEARSAARASVPRVRTLLVCDLADSTALVERLGDSAAAELLRRHDRLARGLMQQHSGREIDKTDGFLALFERPVEAVSFALGYQRALRQFSSECGHVVRARIGIHMGEVVEWHNTAADVAEGAKPVDVEGLAKPVAARLMSLALPGQTLLSGVAFSLAQRAERDVQSEAPVRWLTHGRYRFKGVPAPMLVHEVGESGQAPLAAPPSSGKAEREVPLWRRPSVLTLEALALIAIIAVPIALTLRAPSAIAFGERDWVVVGDLRNLTGEATLDESLETAFRISLEQSRYVNVLPDLKLRDALARMQRPPDTEVDRAVASEIALREGARAVILPTVAEIGGRVRVSAEVVDPSTQTTVYAESADGVGAPSALDSIDDVTQDLRARLGEALKSIENDSAALPAITGGNLDALRAYALATRAQGESRVADAQALYERALQLDPGFALAHLGLARLRMGFGDRASAQVHARAASELRDRLTARDALYADAWLASFGPPSAAMEKWKLLSQIYPDYHAGSFNYGAYASQYSNIYVEAIAAMRVALAPQNPLRHGVHYALASLLAAQENFDEALTQFEAAREMGSMSAGELYAATLYARGDAVRARGVIDEARRGSAHANDLVLARRVLVTAAIGAGDLPLAARLANEAEPAGTAIQRAWGKQFRIAAIGTGLIAGENGARQQLREFVEGQHDALADAADLHRHQTVFDTLLAGYLAARHGDAGLAQEAIALVGDLPRELGHPNVEAMARIARAEERRAAGEADAALDLLSAPPVGEPLYQWHSARMRALRDAGQPGPALQEADWLATHPGRAWLEWGVERAQTPLNVADLTLAALDRAELSAARGDLVQAAESLQRFRTAWPTPTPLIQRRVDAVAALTAARAGAE